MTSSKIAIVHEDSGTVQALIGAFSEAGYHAVGAHTFRDAVARLGGYAPALLVVNGSGLQAALRAAAKSPDIKIVVVN